MRTKLSFLLLLNILCFATTFDVKFSSSRVNYGHDVTQTSDGGYAVVGFTASYEGVDDRDGYLIKTDSLGVSEWQAVLPGSATDFLIKVKETTDGGLVILGKNNYRIPSEFTSCEPWLIKYDKNGKLKWEKIFNDTGIVYNVNDMIIADDGGFLILGSRKTETGPYEVWLMKTDDRGNRLWDKTYTSGPADEGISLVRNFSGGYLLACNRFRYSGDQSTMLVPDQVWGINVDQNGNNISYGVINYSSDYKDCTSLSVTHDNKFIISGYVNRDIRPPEPALPPYEDEPFNQGCFILKFSSNFSTEWLQYLKYPAINLSDIKDITFTGDGGFAVLGLSNELPNGMMIAKTEIGGNLIWYRLYGSAFGKEYPNNLIRSSDNGLVFCGMVDFVNNYPDVSSNLYLVKTDENGNVIYPPAITSFVNDLNNVSIGWEAVSNAGSYIVYGI
jgi:hypothetical protein